MIRTLITGLAIATLAFATDATAQAPAREVSTQRLARRITVDITSRPLREVFPILERLSGLRFQPLWTSDRDPQGLDPETEISTSASNESVLSLVERLIEPAAATWQLTDSGIVQVGSRSRLNAFRRIHVYDVRDLIRSIPDHRRGPVIDLQQALQSGGGSIPITGDDHWLDEPPPAAQRAEELAALIRDIVEPEQWTDHGGEAGTIRIYADTLIINAPDYMHRAIAAPRRR